MTTTMATGEGLAVATHDLRKTYWTRRGRTVAVERLTLEVPAGGVHGFLGPNGSGKTTTIRMLLGLLRPDSGSMHLFGVPVPEQLPTVIGRVGAIVEAPKFVPTFSGRQNLRLLADAVGAPRQRVGEVLDETSLTARADDRLDQYSLGMRQRLAVAATLLKDPDLLIFDEPTNGLDPAGIREIRDTLRELGTQGRTVLVSSHILAEVEQVADTVSIIGRGRLLASGAVREVIGRGATGSVRVGVSDPERAAAALVAAGYTVAHAVDHLTVSPAASSSEDPAAITRILARTGLYVSELTPLRPDLESVFLQLTAGQGLGDAFISRKTVA